MSCARWPVVVSVSLIGGLCAVGVGPLSPASAATASMVAMSDVAGCTSSHQPTGSSGTANVIDDLSGPLAVVGDEVQGQSTTLQDFRNCYHPRWGQFNGRARPVPGNHEYLTSGAKGYFDYFGSRGGPRGKGYYAYTVGDWQVLALNSNCGNIGGCGPGSAMHSWLKSTLAGSSARCQLAYWHHPRWSHGYHGQNKAVGPLFQLLYNDGVELVLNGHEHAYQRFPALGPSGDKVSDGVVEIVLPSAGASFHGWGAKAGPAPVVRNNNTFGVVALTLRSDGWSSRFVPAPGGSFRDSASGSCHS
jgi:hypothetical protein